MANRIKIAIIAALFFASMASYGVYNFLNRHEQKLHQLKTSTQSVVVAGKNITAGTAITEDAIRNGVVKVVPWPKSSLPKGTFDSTESLQGKIVKLHTVIGEPLLESKITGASSGLTIRLQPGKRAMAVKVDEIVGVSGFILPDDRVDVIVTTSPPDKKNKNQKVSKIILQNKRVLSVAQATDQDNGKPRLPRSITLEVTPDEAETLSLATLDGQIILALRAVGDSKLVTTAGSTKGEILSYPSTSRSNVSFNGKRRHAIIVYKGNQKSVIEF